MSNLSAAMSALKNKTEEKELEETIETLVDPAAFSIPQGMTVSSAIKNLSEILANTQQSCSASAISALTTAYNQANQASVMPAVNRWQIAKDNMTKLQEQIKTERKAQNMTQKKLAILSGFSQGTITRAENNGWISISCLLAISNALGKEIALIAK